MPRSAIDDWVVLSPAKDCISATEEYTIVSNEEDALFESRQDPSSLPELLLLQVIFLSLKRHPKVPDASAMMVAAATTIALRQYNVKQFEKASDRHESTL